MTKKAMILYILFGLFSSVIYFVVRFAVLGVTQNPMFAMFAAQVVSIIWGFTTNKLIIFKDNIRGVVNIIKQFISFCMGRGLIFALDALITYIACERYEDFFIHLMGLQNLDYSQGMFTKYATYIGSASLLNTFIFAMLVQLLTYVLNFIISRYIIFKDKDEVETVVVN